MATKKAAATKKSVKKIRVATESVLPLLSFDSVVKSKKTKKKSSSKKSSTKPEVIVVEEVTIGKEEPLKLPYDVSKEYVIVHRCTNCEHVPFSVSRLVTLFSVLIMLLSVSVLIQVGTIDLAKLMAAVSPVANAFVFVK